VKIYEAIYEVSALTLKHLKLTLLFDKGNANCVSIVWPVKKAGYIPQYIGPRYATWNWVKTYRRQTVIWRIMFRKY